MYFILKVPGEYQDTPNFCSTTAQSLEQSNAWPVYGSCSDL